MSVKNKIYKLYNRYRRSIFSSEETKLARKERKLLCKKFRSKLSSVRENKKCYQSCYNSEKNFYCTHFVD